jgi:serine phosphatase RsbU (regulator of sigma subunit)
LLALPLAVMGEVIGLMAVNYGDPQHQFPERRINILAGVASQTSIAVENDRLLKKSAEQERLKQELDVARRIQASFLPPCCPEVPGWQVAALWRSARQVGGDFYDFIPLPPVPHDSGGPSRGGASQDRLGLVVADVADKGVPAALFMALSRTLIRTVAIDGRSPGRAIARVNDLILADARAGLFVTAVYAILGPESGQVTFANAGHMPPLLVRAGDGPSRLAPQAAGDGGKVTLIKTHGMAMGVLPGNEVPEETIGLNPGDILVLYTDGVIEATDNKQEMFGRERLIEVVQQHRDQSATQLVETIDAAIGAFTGDASPFDDLTALVAKRTL